MWAAHQVGEVPGREETTVSWALEGLARHEHSTETAWPYGMPRWPSGRPAAALDAANRRSLPSWRDLGAAAYDPIAADLDAGRQIILTIAVVVAAWYHDGVLVDAPPGGRRRVTTRCSPSAPSTVPTG